MTTSLDKSHRMDFVGLQLDATQIKVGDTVLGAADLPGSTSTSFSTVARIGVGIANAAAALVKIAAGTTAKSQINLAASTAPTAPADGDIWFDGTDVCIRISGSTEKLALQE